jgi:hypothetical protein
MVRKHGSWTVPTDCPPSSAFNLSCAAVQYYSILVFFDSVSLRSCLTLLVSGRAFVKNGQSRIHLTLREVGAQIAGQPKLCPGKIGATVMAR